jgi:shikimate dehydrogenase
MARLVQMRIAGVNVTAPFKAAAARWVADLDGVASRAGSVNTIAWRGARAAGTSTDGAGFLRDLAVVGWSPGGRRVVCVGAGGAARAIGWALAGQGVQSFACYARRPERVDWLPDDRFRVRPWSALASDEGAELRRAELIVQATPLGGSGDAPPIDWRAVPPDALAVDLRYTPPVTPFLAAARARGCRTRGGLGMLLFQGALAFEFWTERRAPLQEMADAIGFPLPGP